MTDGVVSWLIPHLAAYFATGRVPERARERLNGGWPCYGVYEAADGGHVTLGALEPQFWANFCRLVRARGSPAAPPRPGRRPRSGRGGASPAVPDAHRAPSGSRSCTRPMSARARCSRSTRSSGTRSSPTAGSSRRWQHPQLGSVRQVAFPVQMSATPARMVAPPPELGEHTDELLRGLGYDAATIAAFRRDGVVA